jgi:hypothetical protein
MGVLVALTLILYMAIESPMTREASHFKHPDEPSHIQAAEYFSFGNWLPPKFGDPSVLETYSVYGCSRLDDLGLDYLMAGKFSELFRDKNIGFRCFGLLLFIILTVLCFWAKDYRRYFVILLVTPQLWYIFSYTNDDVLPFFLAFLLSFELSDAGKFFYFKKWGPLYAGILLGVLLISKPNYYVYCAFVGGYLILHFILEENAKKRMFLFKRGILMLAVASTVYAGRMAIDFAVNGPHRAQQIEDLANRLAAPEFQPQNVSQSWSFSGLNLRAKGKPFTALFDEPYAWQRGSFLSFFGLYGHLNVYTNGFLYLGAGILSFLLLLVALLNVVAKGKRQEHYFFIWGGFMSVMVLVASIYHSWTDDYQPQGRYLFPLLPILLLTSSQLKSLKKNKLIPFIQAGLFFIGVFSFLIAIESMT